MVARRHGFHSYYSPTLLPISYRQNSKLSLPGNIYHKTLKDILENYLKIIRIWAKKTAEKTLQTVNFNINPLERSNKSLNK